MIQAFRTVDPEGSVPPISMDDLPERLLDRPAPEAARWLAFARLHDLMAARPRLDDRDDTKALHDFRVALRRFRSLLRSYRDVLDDSVTRKTRRRLRQLANASSLSRDSEVRLDWLRERVWTGPAAAAGIEWIERELDRDRIKGDRQFQRALDRNFAPLVEQLQRTLGQYRTTTTLGEALVVSPARDVTARALHAMAGAIQGTLENPHAVGDPELLHGERIAAKRLRYLLEPIVAGKLAPVRVLRTAAAAIAQLERMQDELGHLHDEISFDLWLAARIAESPGEDARDQDAVEDVQQNESQQGGPARRQAPAAFVETLRRRLHRQVARRYRSLESQPWRQRTDRLIRRVHSVADRLARKGSVPHSHGFLPTAELRS